jgi:hypothetical protein
MSHRFFGAATAALLVLGSSCTAEELIGLKVLYAGHPDTSRTKDFVSFLEKHFAKVGSADFSKFREANAKGYDVVIFDWTSIYPRNKTGAIDNSAGSITMPPAPQLSPSFAKACVLIGAAGGQLAGTRQLKINWL